MYQGINFDKVSRFFEVFILGLIREQKSLSFTFCYCLSIKKYMLKLIGNENQLSTHYIYTDIRNSGVVLHNQLLGQ